MTTPDEKLKAAQENLPWLVNDTLPDDQQKEVQTMLNESDNLREEELFWRAVRHEIKNKEMPTAPKELGWQRLKRDIRRDDGKQQGARWRWAAIAASVLMVVQAALVTLPNLQQEGYQMASSSHKGGVIQLQFQDQATAIQIQTLLQEQGLIIIDGPSAAGLYTVTGKEEATVLVTRLKTHEGLIRHVQAE